MSPRTSKKAGASKRGRPRLGEDYKEARSAVRAYLEALEQNRPRRGRKRSPESIERQLAEVEERLAEATGLGRLELLQRRAELTEGLESLGTDKVDLSELEEQFVQYASQYADKKGISYAVFREAGVSADVLRRAGISRAQV